MAAVQATPVVMPCAASTQLRSSSTVVTARHGTPFHAEQIVPQPQRWQQRQQHRRRRQDGGRETWGGSARASSSSSCAVPFPVAYAPVRQSDHARQQARHAAWWPTNHNSNRNGLSPQLAPMHAQQRRDSSGRQRSRVVVPRMAPDEEKMTKRSPLDFPVEWERPGPGRRPDIFPQFSPMKTPLPPPPPADPPYEEEDEEEKKEPEPDPDEDPDQPPEEQPASRV